MPMQPAPVWADEYDAFPCVLAHEYHRLKSLYEAGQYYGAYFQAKDVIESTVKYVILSACAWAKAAGVEGREAGYERVLARQNPSLGLWVNLGREIQRFFKQPQFKDGGMPEPLWALLGKTISWMDKNHLVSWRNEEIGHGALAFDDSPAFRADLLRIISVITEFYRRNAALFAQHTLLTDGVALAGHACARNLDAESGALSLRLGEGEPIALSPFILHMHHGVFFFDEVESRSRTRMMNYPAGEDSVVRTPEITSYYAKLSDQLRSQHIDSSRDVEGGYLSESESALLDRLNVDERYVTPEHIKRWLQDALRHHDRGAFLLTMERGCGKSTFCQKLSRLYKAPELLAEDLDVRTYHFSRAQHSGVSEFKEGLEDQWAREYSEHGQTHMGRFRRFTHFETDAQQQRIPPARQLSLFLGAVLSEVRTARGKQRILLVLDGLDEITDPNLWQYLSCGNELLQGVYLLLTCRSAGSKDEPLPEGLAARLDALHAADRADFARSGEGNRAFLLAYAKKRLPQWTEAELDPLLALCGWRILDLSMNCRLLQNGLTLLDLQGGQTAVVPYVHYLELHYGDARRMMLHRLLLALCTFGEAEPLSLPEIAWMTGRGHVSLDLVAMMNDLAPLLYVQRGYSAGGRQYAGANRYRLVNAGLANALREYLADLLPAFIASLSDAALARAQDKEPPCDGQKLVLAHILDPAAGVPLFASFDASQLHTLAGFIEQAYPLPMQRVLDLHLAQATCLQATWAGRDLLDRKALPDVTDYAWALCRMGEILVERGEQANALTQFTHIYDMLKHDKSNPLLLKAQLYLGSLQIELFGRSDEARSLLLNTYEQLRSRIFSSKMASSPKTPETTLFCETCLALCRLLLLEFTTADYLSSFKSHAIINEILLLHYEAAYALSSFHVDHPSLVCRLYTSLGDCIKGFPSGSIHSAFEIPSPFHKGVVSEMHSHSLQIADRLSEKEKIDLVISQPLDATFSESMIHTQCLLLASMDRDGILTNRLVLARAYMNLESVAEDYELKLDCCEKALNIYTESEQIATLCPEDGLLARKAELHAEKYRCMLGQYSFLSTSRTTEARLLPLYVKRAQYVKQLYESSLALGYPDEEYYHQFVSDSLRIQDLLVSQNRADEAQQWKQATLRFTKDFLKQSLLIPAKRIFKNIFPLLPPLLFILATVLLELTGCLPAQIQRSLTFFAAVFLFACLIKVWRSFDSNTNTSTNTFKGKHTPRPHFPHIARFLLCMEIPTPLFSALVLSLYLKLKKGLSFAFFFDPYQPVTFERLQTLLSPDVVLLFFLCLLLFEHLSSFILLHVYLRFKLRKVRRLLKALTGRIMHPPEKKA